MIEIAGRPMSEETTPGPYTTSSIEQKTFGILSNSSDVYRFATPGELDFELRLRSSIVKSAYELNRSNFSFRVFNKSKCNPDFWRRTGNGGFALLNGVKPSDAIRDITNNSSLYGTECATAMVIVYYMALVDVLPEELFNRLFADIVLMNWQHLDRDLGVTTIRHPAEYLPGDVRYFKNPDVDPVNPQWQGENAVDLGNGNYYGHGIGIANGDQIIASLNRKRIRGSNVSAYLMDMVDVPNFKSLYHQYQQFQAGSIMGY